MTANDPRFLGTLGGFLVDMEFGYPVDLNYCHVGPLIPYDPGFAISTAGGDFFDNWLNVSMEAICRNSPEASAADKPKGFLDVAMQEAINWHCDSTVYGADPYPTHAGDTELDSNLASDTYDILVEQFDQIESDLNDEGFDEETLELAQEHLDLAFRALDEVRIHMARFERAITITAFEDDVDCNTDQHALSD